MGDAEAAALKGFQYLVQDDPAEKEKDAKKIKEIESREAKERLDARFGSSWSREKKPEPESRRQESRRDEETSNLTSESSDETYREERRDRGSGGSRSGGEVMGWDDGFESVEDETERTMRLPERRG